LGVGESERDEEIRAERVDRSAWIPNFQGSGARAGSSIFFFKVLTDGWFAANILGARFCTSRWARPMF